MHVQKGTMASSISSSLVYRNPDDPFAVVIDGARAKESEKTKIEGDPVVQLRRARVEESGFDWDLRYVRRVDIQDVMIVDDTDINCLIWFIYKNIRINFSHLNPSVSPAAAGALTRQLNRLEANTVKEGSTITLPLEGGLSGYGTSMDLLAACRRVGFVVKFG